MLCVKFDCVGGIGFIGGCGVFFFGVNVFFVILSCGGLKVLVRFEKLFVMKL